MQRRWRKVSDAGPLGLPDATPQNPGALLFSGGTTGDPKAVEHTHGNLVASVRAMEHIFPPIDGDVFLPIAPFPHMYGFLQGVLVPMSARGETAIPDAFNPSTSLN
jgi:long-chain acyl-CoA synthetase